MSVVVVVVVLPLKLEPITIKINNTIINKIIAVGAVGAAVVIAVIDGISIILTIGIDWGLLAIAVGAVGVVARTTSQYTNM